MGSVMRYKDKKYIGSATVKKVVLLIFLLTTALVPPVYAADEAGLQDRVREEVRDMIRSGAGEDQASEIARTLENGKFDSRARAEVREMVREAVARGIPLTPLINKMNEGMAKQVSPQGIVRAMEKVRSRYAFAYGEAGKMAFSRNETARFAETVAEGLAAGMAEKDMTAVLGFLRAGGVAKRGKDPVGMAENTALTVRDMARFGVSSAVVSETVLRALEQEYTAVEMEQLRNAFMNRARYETPEGVAHRYGEDIGRGVRGGRLEGGSSPSGGGRSGTGSGTGSGSGGSGSGSGSDGSGSGGSGSGGSGGGGGSGSGSGGSGSGSGSGGSGGGSGSGGSGGGGGSGSGSGGSGGSGSGGGGSGSGGSGGR